jgi:hypothetical protein
LALPSDPRATDRFRLAWEMPPRERTPLSEVLVERLHCGDTFVVRHSSQRSCSRRCGTHAPKPGHRLERRRVERPPYEQLIAEVAATSWSAVGRRYGVSDNAVRKWVRAYERERGGASSVAVGVDWFG